MLTSHETWLGVPLCRHEANHMQIENYADLGPTVGSNHPNLLCTGPRMQFRPRHTATITVPWCHGYAVGSMIITGRVGERQRSYLLCEHRDEILQRQTPYAVGLCRRGYNL